MPEICVAKHRGILPDDWFERVDGIPMTKALTRSVVISMLNPLIGSSVLEIGAGTGAMTVELARAAGEGGRVTSVEVLPASVLLARRNIARAGFAERASVIEGRAPDDIPSAEYGAVFIGGHGPALEAIISRCFELMVPGGRLIVTSITPGATSAALNCVGELTQNAGVWRIHSSSGRRAGADWLMIGNNPVDVIWGDK